MWIEAQGRCENGDSGAFAGPLWSERGAQVGDSLSSGRLQVLSASPCARRPAHYGQLCASVSVEPERPVCVGQSPYTTSVQVFLMRFFHFRFQILKMPLPAYTESYLKSSVFHQSRSDVLRSFCCSFCLYQEDRLSVFSVCVLTTEFPGAEMCVCMCVGVCAYRHMLCVL